MTTQNNNTAHFDPIVTAAAHLLAQRMSVPIQLTDVVCISEAERRNRLLRVRVDNPPPGLPASVIIKQVVAQAYNPDQIDSEDTQRFFRDWAGAEFLSNLPGDPGHGPRFYGGDRQLGFIILEDLGQNQHSLVQPLLEGNAASAEAALITYIRRLGQMHADTLGKAAEYRTLWPTANPALKVAAITQGLETRGLQYLSTVLPELDLPVDPALLTELQGIYKRVEQPGPFGAFVHADLCPDNMFFASGEAGDTARDTVGDAVRLIDFEFARFGHALFDICYPRMLFPGCWCCNRIPQAIVVKLESVYRAELCRTCSAVADDHLYTQALADVCGFALLEETLPWQLPVALEENRQWGLVTVRTRLLASLEAFIDTATEFDRLPQFRNAASQLLATLQARWPETEPLPFYPAFR